MQQDHLLFPPDAPALKTEPAPHVWAVGALCRAVTEALETRFNPVVVQGEILGFSRAASGHCYFSIKDAQGQIRSAMFRRAASSLNFNPRDGEQVEVSGRLTVYEPRGDLQLVVESMRKVGQGSLFEQFLQRKARLEAQGLFEAQRKRALPLHVRGIGVVTSLGAAALHDVITALQRRVPHIKLVLSPSLVQGADAPANLCQALQDLYALAQKSASKKSSKTPPIDLILLVRGGGSMEDLWAFNDEALAHTISQSPVPVVTGIGHETDFTIADFVADMRAPTPTAAAELAAQPRAVWLDALDLIATRMQQATTQQLERQAQRLDLATLRLSRPSLLLGRQNAVLNQHAQALQFVQKNNLERQKNTLAQWESRLLNALPSQLERMRSHLLRVDIGLQAVNPKLVLSRGYAWLQNSEGRAIGSVTHIQAGQTLQATLQDGEVDLSVISVS